MHKVADFQGSGTASDITAVLQKAIAAAHRTGGGRVAVMAGVHVCGGIELLSGVELHLSEGAILRPKPDYEAYAHTRVEVIAEDSDRGMIVARNVRDIAITGPGRIEAGGDAFIVGEDSEMGTWVPAARRPRVLVFDGCRNIRLEDFTISASPMWTIHAIACTGITAGRITVDNDRRMPNTDGFVVDSCEDVSITDCEIRTADDGVVLKTSALPDGLPVGPMRTVCVRNSVIESRSCALKIGTETHADISDIAFEDCRVVQSNRGLGIFSRDGGAISQVRFERIALECRETPAGFWGSGEAITINVIDRREERPAGVVSEITFEDISGTMEGAINLVAPRAGAMRDVTLKSVSLTQKPGGLGTAQHYDLRPTGADLELSADADGRANAWVKDTSGKIIGLEPYPGGMPGVYALNVGELVTEEVTIARPEPLVEGSNAETIVTG